MDLLRLREQIVELVGDYARAQYAPRPFVPGETEVPVAGRVLGIEEITNLVHSALDGWLTLGRFNTAFERALGEYVGGSYVLTVSSGSSANLLAVAALTSPLLGARRLLPGDEVITVAVGFPTTLNPLFLYGLTPVFVDVGMPTYNVIPERVAAAVTERTRAILLAHTLGNPFDLEAITAIARAHDLWLIEDCCDALGSRYRGRRVGSDGALATFSFYPAHQITMGEGGAVATTDPILRRVLESLRDWGRDCWCDTGHDNTCGRRYEWQLGTLPAGYDHKYIYSHLGFNLKITEMQAAVGLAQLGRLPEFIRARRRNFHLLRERLAPLVDHLILPEATPGSEPAWFGLPITLREEGQRDGLLRHLARRRIGTRLLFGGNLTCQPYVQGRSYRVHGELHNSDRIMRDTLWLGVYPGLSEAMVEYVAETLSDYLRGR